jgi:hypothetical protein
MLYRPLAILALSILAVQAAAAADNFVYGQAGSGASTATIGFGHVFDEQWSGRLGFGASERRSYERDFGGNRFDAKPKPREEVDAMLDWYPFSGSGFRLSGGLVLRDHAGLSLTGKPDGSGNYTFNGHTYSAATVGTLQANADTWMLAPRLEVGWESATPSTAGWRFGGNLNLELSKPKAGQLGASGAAGNPALQADLSAQQQRFADDLDKQRFRLGFALSAAYSF